MNTTTYSATKTLSLPFDEAIDHVTARLKDEGFGVLTTIDVKDTLKKKLDVDFDRYVILGACNPPLAHRALQAERHVGLLLPCNVIVYEGQDPAESVVSIIDPLSMMQLSDNAELRDIANEANDRLQNVLDAL